MPNGGLTPDCVHCKHYRGKPLSDSEPFCDYHKINLAYPIRAFCANFADVEPEDPDWLDRELDRSQLHDDWMYVWLGGYEVKFFHVPLVSIVEYGTWTPETFLDAIARLSQQSKSD